MLPIACEPTFTAKRLLLNIKLHHYLMPRSARCLYRLGTYLFRRTTLLL